MNKNREKNIMINLLKGVACICVVFIHVRFPGRIGSIMAASGGFAVPAFFMIAGYYVYDNDTNRIKKKLLKILKILLYGYMIYFIYFIIRGIINNDLVEWLTSNYNWKTPILYIVLCKISFAIPLWYLIAMAETYLFWIFIVRQKKEYLLLRLMIIVFIIRIIWLSFCNIMKLPLGYNWIFLISGVPWLIAGFFFNTQQSRRILTLKDSTLIVTAIIGWCVMVIPTQLDPRLNMSVIGSIAAAFSLFAIALKNPQVSICKPIEYIGEKLSLNVYILHVLVNRILKDIMAITGYSIKGNKFFAWFWPIIVLIVTIAVSYMIEYIKKRRMRKA